MAVKNNDVLGYAQCADCGERATVHRTTRGKGRYLYKRCGCGCDQRTGAAVQTWLYNNTEWLGEAPEPPPNLKPAATPKAEPEPQEPPSEPEAQPEKQEKAETKTPLLLLGITGISAVLLGLMGKTR